MFTVSPADVLTSTEFAKVSGEKSPSVGPLPLDTNVSFDEFAPSEFLSPFVDDVDFVFPDGDDLLSDEMPKTKRARNGAHSFDETGLGGDSSQFSQFASWTLAPEGHRNSLSDKADENTKGTRKRKGLIKQELENPEHLEEDFLSVFAARVAPTDGSTAEIFDSDNEHDALVQGFSSDDCNTASDGFESESSDLKSFSFSESAMMPMFTKHETEVMPGLDSNFGTELGEKRTKRGRKRPKITAEEKAELLRQRNREHARSTRRRKKMYVECLKKQVAELLAKQQQIDSGIFEPLSGNQTEANTIRKAMIQTFLHHRTSNVVQRSRWRDLLDDSFTLTQPRTPFRAMNIGEIFGNNRRVKGIDAVVQDTASITSMLEMIKSRVRQQKPDYRRSVTFSYTVDSSDILIVGDKLMCHWESSTKGLVAAGFSSECSVDGMLKCTFNSKHRITDMEITYDVMAFTRQLQAHSLIDLSVVTANVALPSSMVRCNSAGKLPISAPGAMPLPMMGSIKPPSGLKKVKSAPTGLMQMNPNMMMPGMIPMMLPPGMQMKMQLPMPGMMCMPRPVPGANPSSNATNTAVRTPATGEPASSAIPSGATRPSTPMSAEKGVVKRSDSATSLASIPSISASTMDDQPKVTTATLAASTDGATTNAIDSKAKGATKTPIMPNMMNPNMMNILPSPQPMMMMGGMMPGMLPPPFMTAMPGMMTPPLFPIGQPGHMFQPQGNQVQVNSSQTTNAKA